MMLELAIKEIADTVKDSIEGALKAVSDKYEVRIKELESRLSALPSPEKGERGERGEDGTSVSIEDIRPIIEEIVSSIEIPAPKDGKDYDIEELNKAVKIEVEKQVNALPKAQDGIDGKRGEDGISPTAEEVAKSMEGIFAKWAIDFERQANGVLERAVERMPKPKDGRDALELKDFDIRLNDDLRTLTMSLKSEDVTIERSVIIPTIIDRGVFSDKKEYALGDGVTYGGNFWISQKDNPQGKPSTNQDWRLAVRKGASAKERVKLELPKTVKIGQ